MDPPRLHDLQVLWLLHWLWAGLLQPGTGREDPWEVSLLHVRLCVVWVGGYWCSVECNYRSQASDLETTVIPLVSRGIPSVLV